MSTVLAVLALLLAVVLVAGAIKMVVDAFNGCPIAIVWLCFDGIGTVAEVVGKLLLFVATGRSSD